MTPKDLRQARPLFEEFAGRFTASLVDDRRTESRRERAKAYLRGLLLDAESTKTAEAIALKVHGDPSQVRVHPGLPRPVGQGRPAHGEVGPPGSTWKPAGEVGSIKDEAGILKRGSVCAGCGP